MEYQVTHTTEYTYHQPVSLCYNIAKLLLRDHNNQLCKSSSISITPTPDILQEYEDYFGNKVIYFAIQREHTQLTVSVQSQVEKLRAPDPTLNFYTDVSWETARHLIQEPGDENFIPRQYILATAFTEATDEILQYAKLSFTPGRSVYEVAKDIMQRIHDDFEFDPGFTTVATPVDQVMQAKKGVCQDFAHLAIACIRSAGLPARYISGYIETLPPGGKEKLTGVDASHAWFSVYIPDAGWVDFDPTNNMIPGLQHITIGWGRDYEDITPLKGVIISSGTHELNVSVDVKRIA